MKKVQIFTNPSLWEHAVEIDGAICLLVMEEHAHGIIEALKECESVQLSFVDTRCLVCDKELLYNKSGEKKEGKCHFCGEVKEANCDCPAGHFVCRDCWKEHGRRASIVIDRLATINGKNISLC